MDLDIEMLFQKGALTPVIVQDQENGEVLMLGYADRQAVLNTIKTKTAWFFSRSRQKLWNKGETSGNFIRVQKIVYDCDADTVLYLGIPSGPVCHTGNQSCFFQTLWEDEE